MLSRAMDRYECLALLQGRPLGRIGLSIAALPTIEPVSRYHVLGNEILFHVRRDSRIEVALSFNLVSFQVDDLNNDGVGHSVVVVGRVSPAPVNVLGLVNDAITREEDALFMLRCDLIQGRAIEASKRVVPLSPFRGRPRSGTVVRRCYRYSAGCRPVPRFCIRECHRPAL